MPGYPLFLAAVGASLGVARLVQAGVDVSTVLATYLLARRWLARGPSTVAAGIVAVNPFYIYFSALLLSETLYTAMLMWGMVLLAWGRWPGERGQDGRKASAGLGLLAGVVLVALAIHVRPSGIGLPVVLALATVAMNRYRPKAYDPQASRADASTSPRPGVTIGKALGIMIVALLCTFLALLPWAWRNYHVLHTWVWTTTNGGFTLYDGFNPHATGASDQTFVQRMPELSQMNEVERSRYLGGLARRWIAENPSRAGWLGMVKVARTWSPAPLSSEYGGRWHYWLVGLAYSMPFFICVLVGLWRGPLPWRVRLFLLMPAVYFTLVHAASVGSLRYRMPAEAPMAVLAASVFAGLAGAGRQEA